jgi:hypothetical protein
MQLLECGIRNTMVRARPREKRKLCGVAQIIIFTICAKHDMLGGWQWAPRRFLKLKKSMI